MSNNLLQTNTIPVSTSDNNGISLLENSQSTGRPQTASGIDVSEPIQVLVNAVNLAQRRGAYTLQEASLLNNAITRLNEAVNGSSK